MKTQSITLLVTSLLGCAALCTLGCKQKDKTGEVAASSAQTSSRTSTARSESIPYAKEAQAEIPAAPVGEWKDIRDASFALCERAFTDLARLKDRVDGQVKELTGRRTGLAASVDTKNWDFAMKEMDASRTSLWSAIEDLRKATPETWEQEKDKVGVAWTRSQDAYAKVLASTTIGTTASNE